MTLQQAIQQNANAPMDKNRNVQVQTGPPPSVPGGSPGGSPTPPKQATAQPTRPLGGENAQVAAGTDVATSTGVSTFARPGTRAFQPFQGRALASQLRDPSQQASIAYQNQIRDAAARGDLSRVSSAGFGGGGMTLGDALGGDKRDQLTDTILKQLGL